MNPHAHRLVTTLRYLRTVLDHPLNTDRKLAALGRWARWHVGSRLAPGAVVVPLVNEAKLIVRPGMRGATENVYTGLAEFADMAFLLHVLRSSDRFLDVGSNVGVYTVLAAAVCGTPCIAAEPVPATFAALVDNLRVNGIEPLVDALNVALGDADGVIEITVDEDCRNHIVHGAVSNATAQVPLRTVDGLLERGPVSLIKVDVEGFESRVLAGARDALAAAQLLAIIVELNGSGERYGEGDRAVHSLLGEIGFRPYAYAPFERRLIALSGPSAERNTIYVRDRSAVEERLRTADAFRVLHHAV